MDIATKLVTLMTGIVALSTAVVAYRAKRLALAPRIEDPIPKGIVLNITYPEPSRWPWKFARYGAAVFGIASGAYALHALFEAFIARSPVLLVNAVFLGLCAAGYAFAFRTFGNKPWALESRVRKRASIDVQGSFEAVLSLSNSGLKAIGARIDTIQNESSQLTARTPFSWRSAGEKVNVQLNRLDEDRVRVYVVSDSIIPTTLYDFGKNARNIREFIQWFTRT